MSKKKKKKRKKLFPKAHLITPHNLPVPAPTAKPFEQQTISKKNRFLKYFWFTLFTMIPLVIGFWNDTLGLRSYYFPKAKDIIVLSSARIDLGLGTKKTINNFFVRNIGEVDLYQVAVKLQLHSSTLSLTNNDVGVEMIDVPSNSAMPSPISGDPFNQALIAFNGIVMHGRDTTDHEALWLIISHLPPKANAGFRIRNQSFKTLPPGDHYLLTSVSFFTNALPASLMADDGALGLEVPTFAAMGIKSIGPGRMMFLATAHTTQIEGADIVTNAEHLLVSGKWDETEKEYTRAIERNPSLGVAYANRTVVRLMKGNIEGAYQDSLKALSLLPDDPLTYANVAQCLQSLGRKNEALTNYSKAISLSGTNKANLIYARGVVLSELNRYSEARRDFDQAILLGCTNAWPYYSKGVTLLKENSFNNAINEFSNAIAKRSDMEQSYLARSFAFAATNQYGQAARDLKEAMRLNTSLRTEGNVALLSTYEALDDATSGREDAAIEYFSKAIASNPKDCAAYGNRASVYIKKGDIEKAMADYRVITNLPPSLPASTMATYNLGMYSFNLGNSCLNQGDMKGAIAHYQESCKLNPSHAESHFYLAIALSQTGAIAASQPHFEKALKLNPSLGTLMRSPIVTNNLIRSK